MYVGERKGLGDVEIATCGQELGMVNVDGCDDGKDRLEESGIRQLLAKERRSLSTHIS